MNEVQDLTGSAVEPERAGILGGKPAHRGRGNLVPAIAALAVIAMSGLLYATLPPSPDQWFLGYTGWRLTEGAIPYHDFADGNWPGCHWLHALSVLLLGNTPYTWRVFDFGLMLACVLFAADTVRSLWGRRAGWWMLVLYPALYVVLGRWFAGERDIVGAHLLFVSLWFYWTGLSRGGVAWQAGTGLFIALAALVKPTFAVFGGFLAVHCILAVPGAMRPLRERAAHLAVAGITSVLGVLLGFLLLLAEGTHLADFWDLAVQSVVVRYGHDTVATSGSVGVLVRTSRGAGTQSPLAPRLDSRRTWCAGSPALRRGTCSSLPSG